MRTVLGVIAGSAVFGAAVLLLFALSGREPHDDATLGFMVVSIVYGALIAFAAGWVAGAVARRHDRLASTVVAVLIAVVAGVSWAGARGAVSQWLQLATIVVIAPSVLAGGALHHARNTK